MNCRCDAHQPASKFTCSSSAQTPQRLSLYAQVSNCQNTLYKILVKSTLARENRLRVAPTPYPLILWELYSRDQLLCCCWRKVRERNKKKVEKMMLHRLLWTAAYTIARLQLRVWVSALPILVPASHVAPFSPFALLLVLAVGSLSLLVARSSVTSPVKASCVPL